MGLATDPLLGVQSWFRVLISERLFALKGHQAPHFRANNRSDLPTFGGVRGGSAARIQVICCRGLFFEGEGDDEGIAGEDTELFWR